MQKQKMRVVMFALISLFGGVAFAGQALANGAATVSWTAPTTDEGGGALDLAGYRIFYSTSAISCTSWDATSDQTSRQAITLAATHVDVTEAATLRDSAVATKRGYTFNTGSLLTPGQTYYFTVVAYDSAGNYGKCINDSDSNKTASKLIYHTGNLKNSGVVGPSDLSIFAGDFGRTSWCRIAPHLSDINGDCTVNASDLSIFAGEYGN